MKLKGFMDDAYGGKVRRKKRLEKRSGDFVLGFEDFVQRLGEKPSRKDVEELAPSDEKHLLSLVTSATPENNKRDQKTWGYLSGLAAERSPEPLILPARDFAGLGMKSGMLILDAKSKDQALSPPSHVGEGMTGGRILVRGGAGHYLGQVMEGGGIVADSCEDYAFRNMKGGWGVVKGNAQNYLGVGNFGGKILVKGKAGLRTGWLMHGGRIRVNGNVGYYLGLMMSGGKISIGGRSGGKAGWRMKGGTIIAQGYGPNVGAGKVGGKIFRRTAD